jgi:regulator of protease activity HflC (stomatin/prohibitin superfamily)
MGKEIETYETFEEKLKEIERDHKKIIIKGIFLIIIGMVVLSFLFGSFYTIQAGERGILLTFGKPDLTAKGEGLGFKIPFVQSIVKMDVKTQKYETPASSASKDLQTVSTTIAVNYHLSPEYIPYLYKDIGTAYNERVIQPTVQEVVKAVTAEFTAEELITKRPQVKEQILITLQDRLRDRGILIEDVSITNFDFSSSFNEAIEAKVTAEQLKLKADRDLERIKIEAEQRITQAEAEAEAIKIQAAAIVSQGGKDYVQLQAISKWDGKMPLITGDNTPFVDITSLLNQQ